MLFGLILLALTRAEIIARMRAPVVTQADGFVKVYADCPEDMRREFQAPIGSFAADTVKTLYQGLLMKPQRYLKPGLIIHVGGVRTNETTVLARAATNENEIVTRVYVKSPAHADLIRLRLEIVKAFYRAVKGVELTDDAAVDAYRAAVPALRIEDERWKLESWLAGERQMDFKDGLRLMRKVIEPGVASRRDVLTFASRLFFYPALHDEPFLGRFHCVSFREAIDLAKDEPRLRRAAFVKANELPVLGGGRGDKLAAASLAYSIFLLGLAKGEKSAEELRNLLETAETRLCLALEGAK